MAPDYNRGDLVLVRNLNSYRVGEIVAYDHPNIGTVFHRIIQQVDDRFVLKGDNNNWNDSFEASPKQIIGKLWIHIPTIGYFLQYLRTPWIFSIVVTGLVILFYFSLFSESKNPAIVMDKERIRFFISRAQDKVVPMENKISEKIFVFAVIGFASFLLLMNSFSKPLERSIPDNLEFTHQGKIEYFAAVPKGIYEGDILQSGDPIFRQVSDSIGILFSYQFSSDQNSIIEGDYQLTTEISESSGWIRTLDITPKTEFSGNAFTTSGTLELSRIQELTDYLEEQTGLYNNHYTLTVRPKVFVHGLIDNREFENGFTPGLTFSFEDQKLELLKETTNFMNSLNPVETGIIQGMRNEANTISLLGFQLNVLIARIASVYFLIFALAGIFWFGYKYIHIKDNRKIESSRESDK